MRKIILFALASIIYNSANAQNLGGTIKSPYYNVLSINPAYAGENGPFGIIGVFGNQFRPGSYLPYQVEQTVVVDGQLANNGGLAFSAYRSTAGNYNRNSYSLNYSKGQDIGDLKLKFGVNGGMEVQPSLAVVGASSQRYATNLGIGVLAAFNGFTAGIAQPTLFQSKNYKASSFAKTTNFNIGYIYQNEDDAFSASGYLLLMRDFVSNSQTIDFNAKVIFSNRLGIGIYGRNLNGNADFGAKGLIPYLDLKLSQSTNVGASYDSQLLNNATGVSSPGVFQLMLRYTNNPPDSKSKFVHY